MRKPLIVVALVVAAGLCGLLWQLRREPTRSGASGPRAPEGDARPLDGDAAATARDPRAAGLHSPAEVESYLAELEARARANGAVGDAEIRQGLDAIEQLRDPLGPEQTALRARDYVDRMNRLKQELAVQPIRAELDDLAGKIAREDDPVARDKLVSAYRAAAKRLPEMDRLAAMERLKKVQHPPEP